MEYIIRYMKLVHYVYDVYRTSVCLFVEVEDVAHSGRRSEVERPSDILPTLKSPRWGFFVLRIEFNVPF
jgi:hypothetical protein